MVLPWKGKFVFYKYCEVQYLPRTEDISTTQIKNKLTSFDKSELDTIKESLHDVIVIVNAMTK